MHRVAAQALAPLLRAPGCEVVTPDAAEWQLGTLATSVLTTVLFNFKERIHYEAKAQTNAIVPEPRSVCRFVFTVLIAGFAALCPARGSSYESWHAN